MIGVGRASLIFPVGVICWVIIEPCRGLELAVPSGGAVGFVGCKLELFVYG